jgi:hypothetical protein
MLQYKYTVFTGVNDPISKFQDMQGKNMQILYNVKTLLLHVFIFNSTVKMCNHAGLFILLTKASNNFEIITEFNIYHPSYN